MTSTFKSLSSCNPFALILHVVTILKQHMKSSRKILGVHRVSDIVPCWKNPVVQVNDIDWSNTDMFSARSSFYYEVGGMA